MNPLVRWLTVIFGPKEEDDRSTNGRKTGVKMYLNCPFFFRVVNKLLRTVKNQYYILKGHGLATSDIHEQFENLQQLIEGKTVVGITNKNHTLG